VELERNEPPNFLDKYDNIQVSDFEQMKWIYYNSYRNGDKYIFLESSEKKQNQIWDLIAWGVHFEEPFGIALF
jgi:hypothetical protein